MTGTEELWAALHLGVSDVAALGKNTIGVQHISSTDIFEAR
jgi:hypothetical protein